MIVANYSIFGKRSDVSGYSFLRSSNGLTQGGGGVPDTCVVGETPSVTIYCNDDMEDINTFSSSTIYTNNTLTTVFNGGNKWWLCGKGVIRIAFRISTVGEVDDYRACIDAGGGGKLG